MSTCQSNNNSTSRPSNMTSSNNTNTNMPPTAISVPHSDSTPALDNNTSSPITNSTPALDSNNSSPITNSTPALDNSNSSPITNNSSPAILSNDGSPLFNGVEPPVSSSGSPHVLSSNSPLILSSSSPVDRDNSAGHSPIIITPHSTPSNLSQPQFGISAHILSLASSVTPLGRGPSSRAVPIVHTPCGSSWNLGGASNHSNKNKREVTKKPDEPRPYFVDQNTGKRYMKCGKLGEGGFGLVYRVVNDEGETFALKTFKADGSGKDFHREIAMFVAAGQNDNLVKFFGAVQDPSGNFPLFELCRPDNVSDLIQSRGRLTYPEICYFGLGIAAGLAHLHNKGVIHCDLKPENVLITFDMQVRIGDLGLSERYNLKGGFRGLVGTKYFVAPEVVNKEPHTYHMDTFSFGCIIYMMLLGAKPCLTTLSHTYPKRLEEYLCSNQESEEPEDRLSADAQALLRALLSFSPPRPKPSRMAFEKFFLHGHSPTKLTEDVFHTPYTPINEHKRKGAPTVEVTKIVQKAKLDDLDNPNI